ncbi:alpha/beta hydrolase [Dysgonomonas sp. OttesenSCG-928-M03]|nr:alpha/beta hydrolase [Dysgonomonas sp. OttesenSCG-928-M03]
MIVNVYFVSGLSANCQVFDKLELPEGYQKKYIEWYIPRIDETLEEYARNMAANIDTTQPFILVGYSLGGIIIQEMNHFLSPLKNIIIASIKDESEIPPLLRLGRKIKFAQRFPFWQLVDNRRVKEIFAHFVYHIKDIDMLEYVSYTNPVYMKWGVTQILNWHPSIVCPNLFHIHGTRDQTFPHKLIKNAYVIKGGDHFMVFKRHKKISAALNQILLKE